jgi:UDPglucose 6-dehydrogenase
MKTIGIVGNTYVGAATSLLGNHHAMSEKETKMLLYDEDPALCSHEGITMRVLSDACDFIFICIPTPMSPDGGCSTYEVKKAVFELLDSGYDSERIVVRSTVSVGTCKDLGVMFMPEFLTESKWKEDFINQGDWILGTNDRDDSLRDGVCSIFERAFDNNILLKRPKIHFTTTEEAELTKYVRNCFFATKISFFNEINSFCEFHKIDYARVRDMTVLDDRIADSHTMVPGPDGKKGFGGPSLPKDMIAFQSQLSKVSSLLGLGCGLIKSSILRNNKIDRPEKDWQKDSSESFFNKK